ncbi:hypothetical protein [Serratia fonticola]|uniref:hypothetical protein n=1 Tax=Serratia fonticola TaxID=47917 RepID=UPI000463A977|nr:hypothetical protein [Serratia fonticola]
MSKLIEIGSGDLKAFDAIAVRLKWKEQVIEAAREVVICKSKIVRSVYIARLVELFRQEPEKP